MSPQDKHRMLIEHEYLTQSRKQSTYNNFINDGVETSNGSKPPVLDHLSLGGQVEEYNTQMSNASSLTTNTNKVSGKILQKKHIQLSDNSSAEFENQHPQAKSHQKIDLSASIDLRNL